MYNKKTDEEMMVLAIAEAVHARERGDYFFGAVVADGDKILARGGNRVKTMNNSTCHVETEMINYAVGTQNARYLTGATLYTTCEPCVMCFGAMFWADIKRVVWAMNQDDLREYGQEHGNKTHRYRPSPIRINWTEMWNKHEIRYYQIMREQCLQELNKPNTK